MSAFTGSLTLTHLNVDWRHWQLVTPLSYELGQVGSGKFIDVPAGFITDGASIPRPLWWLLPVWGTYSRAVAVHDYLCWLLIAESPHQYALSRKAADRILLEAMGPCGTSWPVRLLIYGGVRFFALWRGLT